MPVDGWGWEVREAPGQATPPDRPRPHTRRNSRGIATRSPDSKRKGTPAAGRSGTFLGPQIEVPKLRAAMESSDPDPTDDSSMDAFLDKFQSQPYRGGFREDQWEEVGRGASGVGAWFSRLGHCQRTCGS